MAGRPSLASRVRAVSTSVALGSVLGVAGAALSTVGGFLFVVVATRSLGAEGSGGLFVAVAVFTVLANVGKLGTDTSLVRFVSRALTQRRASDVPALVRLALSASMTGITVLAAALFVFAEPVADLIYADSDAQPGAYLLRLVAVFLPFATLVLLLLAVTRGFGSVAPFVTVQQVLIPLLRPVVVGAVCLAGGGVSDALLAWLVPVLLGLLVAGYALRRRLSVGYLSDHDDPAAPDGSPVTAREFWGFAAPRALGGTLEILAPWFGVLMLSALSGSGDAGIFTAVARVATAGTMVMVAMRLAMGPHLSAAFASGDRARLEAMHEHATTWAVLVSFPFFLTVGLFPGATLALFGPAFPSGAAALVILAVANLVNVAVGNVQSIVLMGGRSSWNLASTALALGTQAVLGVALIPSYGLVGAGIALGAGVVANNALSYWQVRRGLGVRVWSRSVVVAMVLTVGVFGVVGGVVRVLMGPSPWALLVAAVVSLVVEVALVLHRPDVLKLREGWLVLTRNFGAARSQP